MRLIEHVGSTAVPGLAAKPVVDIVVGVDDPDDEDAYLPVLEAPEYELRVREPQHRCLRIGDPHEPVNLHCYPPAHDEVRKMLVFQDRLRADIDDRLRYKMAKRELAQREWRDMNYYAEAKHRVIAAILHNAGWTEPGWSTVDPPSSSQSWSASVSSASRIEASSGPPGAALDRAHPPACTIGYPCPKPLLSARPVMVSRAVPAGGHGAPHPSDQLGASGCRERDQETAVQAVVKSSFS